MFNHENLKPVNTLFFGVYIGVVEDNNDPEKMGRCKIRVLGLHTDVNTTLGTDGISTEQLPWATPAGPIQGGGISGRGWSGVPEQGSHVLITFVGGDHSFPIYFAAIQGKYLVKPDFSKGFSDPSGSLPATAPSIDYHSAGRGVVIDHGSATGTEPANPSAPVYPKNQVLDVGGKIIVEHDATPGKERWSITHFRASDNKASYMEIQPNGDIVHKAQGKRYDITVGDDYIHVGGAVSSNVVGNQDESIGGTLNIVVTGDTTVTAPNITHKKSGQTVSGVVTRDCICAFTGQIHPQGSATVKASKD